METAGQRLAAEVRRAAEGRRGTGAEEGDVTTEAGIGARQLQAKGCLRLTETSKN